MIIKHFFKFKKYLLLTVLAYVVIYVTYSVAVPASKVDLYFVFALFFILMVVYWMSTGVFFPSKMPFWKIKKRILVLLVGTLWLCAIAGIVIAAELYFFNRNPILSVRKNMYYLYYGFRNIHPLDDDALSRFHRQNDSEKME